MAIQPIQEKSIEQLQAEQQNQVSYAPGVFQASTISPAPIILPNQAQQPQNPIQPTTPQNNQIVGQNNAIQGNGSIVDYLNSQGQTSDFNSRTQLAQQYGIQGYTGTAEQNTQLLGYLQGGQQGTQENQITYENQGEQTYLPEQTQQENYFSDLQNFLSSNLT